MTDITIAPDDENNAWRKILMQNGQKLTDEQVATLLHKLADGQMSANQLSALMKITPAVSSSVIEYLISIPKLSSDIKSSHEAGVNINERIFREQVRALRGLGRNAQSDEARLKLAEAITEAAKEARQANVKLAKIAEKSRLELIKSAKYVVGGMLALGFAATRLTSR